jgi:hypothetical protein
VSRYYVDLRVGCVAVMDSMQSDTDYPGLHADTQGVVKYWEGKMSCKTCPTCGHELVGGWAVDPDDKAEAYRLCDEMNAAEESLKGGGK